MKTVNQDLTRIHPGVALPEPPGVPPLCDAGVTLQTIYTTRPYLAGDGPMGTIITYHPNMAIVQWHVPIYHGHVSIDLSIIFNNGIVQYIYIYMTFS